MSAEVPATSGECDPPEPVIDAIEPNGPEWRLEEEPPVATDDSLPPKTESLCPGFDSLEAWAEE